MRRGDNGDRSQLQGERAPIPVIQTLIFYLFASLVVLSATMVILARNPVHSVLWLILAFFNAAGLFLLLGAEFLAMILVIVYVGAVAVLFLFVVMMLDIDFAQLRAGFARYLPFGLLLALVLLAELIVIGGAWQSGVLETATRAVPIAATSDVTNTQAIGEVLYTRFIYVFQGAGLVLLTALIGAVVLTQRTRGGVRRQNIAAQNARTPENAIEIVNVPVGEGVKL